MSETLRENYSTRNQQRISEFDALRGIAALAVVFFHYTFFYGKNVNLSFSAPFLFEYGRFGVNLFFMISGFVIFLTLERTKSPLDFILSRFIRLYPVYWVSILMNILLILFLEKEINLKQMLFNFLMLQGHFNIKHLDGVYWTLTLELSFYAFMLIIFMTNLSKHIISIGIFYIIVSISYIKLKYSLHFFSMPQYVEYFTLMEFFHLFFAGIVFYKIKIDGLSFDKIFALFFSLAAERLINAKWHVSFLIIASLFLIFHLINSNKMKFLNNPVLIFFGSISYSLYLVHENLGFFIMDQLTEISNINSWFVIFCPMVIVVILATFINRMIEIPAMNWLKHIKSANSRK